MVENVAYQGPSQYLASGGSPLKTSERRLLSPRFVATLGEYFVAVDQLQPVAASFSVGGELADVRSWWRDVPIPEVSGWPNRKLALDGNTLFVQNLQTGDVVALEIDARGNLEHRLVNRVPAGVFVNVEPRLWTAPPVGYRSRREGDAVWSAESNLDYFFWSTKVTLNDQGREVRKLTIPEPATVVSYDFFNADAAMFCVQRANKRPWPFRPEIDLWLVAANSDELSATVLRKPDITDVCWKKIVDSERVTRRHVELASYLSYSIGQYQSVRQYGARNVELVVLGDVAEGDVDVEIRFALDDVPGVTFVRRDKLFDELGNLAGGLRDMNVSLVEDLQAGLAQRLWRDQQEVVAL